jgi:hypothetical protein
MFDAAESDTDGGQGTDVQPKSESIFDRRRAAIMLLKVLLFKVMNSAYQDRINRNLRKTLVALDSFLLFARFST